MADDIEAIRALVDRYSSVHVDDMGYRTNPDLRELVDRVCEVAGIKAHDVTKDGVTVWRDHATLVVFDLTSAGEKYIRDGEMARRTVSVSFEPVVVI